MPEPISKKRAPRFPYRRASVALESIRPPIHAVLGEGDVCVGVGGEIIFVEGHGLSIQVYKVDKYTGSLHVYLSTCLRIYFLLAI